MDYREALDWIHSLCRFGNNPGLERVEKLLAALGNPEKRLRCVHVAGTNGKGSTCAFLAAMLEAEGFRVGLYTSPYLEAFTNRMAVDGTDIQEDKLIRLVEKVKPLVEQIAATEVGQPTEFEVVTALAFAYFAEVQPDWVVVEVGLGGRLDATNVINPAVAAITNIGLEHTQILGETIGAIAGEKGGIIKQGVPVVTAAEKEDALTVFKKLASERGCKLYEMDTDMHVSVSSLNLDGLMFDYKSPWRELTGLQISLLGRHQARNAALALAARELMPVPFREDAARAGLLATRWPGRLELFSRNPVVLVDGAHNVDGILSLRAALAEILGNTKLRLVLGILADKAVDGILREIVPLATAGVIITKPANPRAADPREVAEIARRFSGSVPVTVAATVPEAVEMALAATKTGEALCISGSLYTISEAREILKGKYPDK